MTTVCSHKPALGGIPCTPHTRVQDATVQHQTHQTHLHFRERVIRHKKVTMCGAAVAAQDRSIDLGYGRWYGTVVTRLLLGRKVLLYVGLDAAKHEGPKDGVQLLDHVVARALVRLQAVFGC